MKILFLVKFYQPFDRGGSEWSTHDLAKLLVEKGHSVTILTPNYSNQKSREIIDGIEITRHGFFIKLSDPKSQISPIWTNNIFWFIYSSFLCTWLVLREKFDLIHVHNNEFIPASVIASIFTKKKVVATFRDYQAVCALGFCLWQKNKACNLLEFISYDFVFFWKNYVSDKSLFKYILLLGAAIRSRVMQKIVYFLVRKIDYKVGVSKKLIKIFKANGIDDITLIYNPILTDKRIKKVSNREIIYIGKLSKGKGIDLLVSSIPKILEKLHLATFYIIGSGYLKRNLTKTVSKLEKSNRIHFLGHLDHNEALSRIRRSALVIIPSVWPEPLPRSALEAILSGTPVVATKVGGIEEIIKDKRYGILCKPKRQSIENAVISAYQKKDKFNKNIASDLIQLRKIFSVDVANHYLKVYRKALNP